MDRPSKEAVDEAMRWCREAGFGPATLLASECLAMKEEIAEQDKAIRHEEGNYQVVLRANSELLRQKRIVDDEIVLKNKEMKYLMDAAEGYAERFEEAEVKLSDSKKDYCPRCACFPCEQRTRKEEGK